MAARRGSARAFAEMGTERQNLYSIRTPSLPPPRRRRRGPYNLLYVHARRRSRRFPTPSAAEAAGGGEGNQRIHLRDREEEGSPRSTVANDKEFCLEEILFPAKINQAASEPANFVYVRISREQIDPAVPLASFCSLLSAG